MKNMDMLTKILNYSETTPHAKALVDEHIQMTYFELKNEINEVIRVIHQQNLKGKIVVLQIPRNIYFPIIVLALTKENITFIPQDITQPKARLQQMIDLAKAQIVVTLHEGKYVFTEIKQDKNVHTTAWAIYFTSGSTGIPKAVEIPKKNVENTVVWQKDSFQLNEQDRIACFTPYSFAISYIELFSTLYSGGTLYILNEDLRHDLTALEIYLNKNKITFMNVTATIGELVIRSMNIPSLRILTLSGQRFPDIDISCATYRIFNIYGNTECGATTICEIDPIKQEITLGKPVENMNALVLGDNYEILSDGEIGELFITGPQVATGYLLNEDVTKKVFINIQHLGKTIRGYRTGDFARILPSGNIEYNGRRDRQYKINGIRIDLAEIEKVIRKLIPSMKQKHIIVSENQICCWITSEELIDSEIVLSEMKRILPSIMIPTQIIQLENLPLNSNGKIDEIQLLKLRNQHNISKTKREVSQNQKDLEKYLQGAWSQILNIEVEKINYSSDFKKLGATSLQIMELGVKILQDLNKKINFVDLHFHTKLSEMVMFLGEESQFQPIYTFVKRDESMKDTPALFVIHSGNTGSDVYKPLFSNIDSPKFPIYVIEPYNLLTEGERINGIEHVAAYYIQLIEEFTPEKEISKIKLMGWSYGGVVANEICYQLQNKKNKKYVNELTIIDSPFYLEQSDLELAQEREKNGYYRKYFNETHIFEGMDKKNITTEHLIENNNRVFQDLYNYEIKKTTVPTTFIRSMVEEKPLTDKQIRSIFEDVLIKNVYSSHDYLFVEKETCLFIKNELHLIPKEVENI